MYQTEDVANSYNITEIGKILSSLASEDAIKIFIAAKEGIGKSANTIKELDLTSRKYYLRLNKLISAGLIEKKDEKYQLTMLGEVCYSFGQVFNTTLDHRDRLDLADRLRKTNSISLDETKKIMEAISSKGIIGSLGVAGIINPIKMIAKYDDLVLELVTQIDEAKKNVYLASYYTDYRGIEAILRALDRGLTLHLLSGSRESVSEKLQLLHLIVNPSVLRLYSTFLNGKIRVRSTKFPFSFCVVDEKYAIIELPNPITNTFYMGFCFKEIGISKSLIETFEVLYKNGVENSIVSQFKHIT
ncbi:MAG: hypothetical protein QG670_440 [Thermoproteota archaeon]|nr:hypothetical protein [Thermoproteota archaeon]